MANAIRVRTVQKGTDPRDCSLLAAGGAGPLHAAEVARLLDISEVIVPPYSGINSVVGLLSTDLRYDAAQTTLIQLDVLDIAAIRDRYEQMESRLSAQFRQDDVAEKDYSVSRYASVRYVGQGYEPRIDLPTGNLNEENLQQSLKVFHQIEYGRSLPDAPIEIVNLHVSGTGKMPSITSLSDCVSTKRQLEIVATRPVQFRLADKLQSHDTKFIEHGALPVERELAGPAVILQSDSTTVVPPDFKFFADDVGNLILINRKHSH
ncbi:MAG: hydantoinase/oxoprolinase family protein [Gammaproteobacteria bacterium]